MKIIDELERLNEKATPGEWTYDDGVVYSATEPPSQYEIPRLFIGKHVVEVQNLRDSDSELIVLMRNNIDALIELARSVQAYFDAPFCPSDGDDSAITNAEQKMLTALERLK